MNKLTHAHMTTHAVCVEKHGPPRHNTAETGQTVTLSKCRQGVLKAKQKKKKNYEKIALQIINTYVIFVIYTFTLLPKSQWACEGCF